MRRTTGREGWAGWCAGALLLLLAALALWYLCAGGGDVLARWRSDAPPPVPFFTAMALLPLAGVPPTPFFVAAGVSFSLPLAVSGSVAALAANFLLTFWIAGSALRPRLVRMLSRRGYRIPELGTGHGMRLTLLARLIPVMPGFVKNYLLCLAGVPLRIFLPVSMFTSTLYALGFIVLGESIFERDARRLLAALAGLFLLAGFLFLARRRLHIGG